MIKSIAFTNNKGGVAKTTTTLNFGACLAMHGFKVLLIDGDPQSNLTSSFGLPDDMEENLGNYLLGKQSFLQVKKTIELEAGKTIDILAAARQMEDAEVILYSYQAREGLLKRLLEKENVHKQYDFILMDCAPNLGLFTTNALTACNEFIIPYQAEYFSTKGTKTILEFTQICKNTLNPILEFAGIVVTRFNEKSKSTGKSRQELFQDIKASGLRVYDTVIRDNSKLMESPMYGQTIFQHAPESNGAHDYYSFVEEYLTKNNIIPQHGTII